MLNKTIISALAILVIVQFLSFADLYRRFLQINQQQVNLACDFIKFKPIYEQYYGIKNETP